MADVDNWSVSVSCILMKS